VKDIARRDVRDLVEGIAERRLRKGTTDDGQEKVGAPIMANRVLSLVKKMFNFALDREWIDANPAARLKPVSPVSRRDRVLSPEEIRTLWRELDSEHHRIATLFRTQFLTAQRPGEVSKMGWAQLNPALFERTADGIVLPSKLEPIVWTIPGKETKNGLAHEVPLSSVVIDLLRDLAKRDEEERAKINTLYRAKKHQPAREPSEYVFPSRTRKGPIKDRLKKSRRPFSGFASAAASSSSPTIFAGPRRR